jgi:tetratricopeptide (TPR) repeat protein
MRAYYNTDSKNVDMIHDKWCQNREAALAEFFDGLRVQIPAWFSPELESGSPMGLSEHRFRLSFGTTIAVCVESHDLAAVGYFALAELTRNADSPNTAGRLWYERSLDHAKLAKDDLGIARAAYFVGILDASQELYDRAQERFKTALAHADRAGNPGGKSAALYQLSRIEMARGALKAASDYAMESYLTSMKAKQYQPAAETLGALFSFYHELGVDYLADSLSVHFLTTIVSELGSGEADDSTKMGGAAGLRAIAPLNAETRNMILSELGEKIGQDIEKVLREQLQLVISNMRQGL